MKTHSLKTDPETFRPLKLRAKTFEIRFDDRGFEVGDDLCLNETRYAAEQMKSDPDKYPLGYTGDSVVRVVTHILRGPIYGLAEGWVIMSVV